MRDRTRFAQVLGPIVVLMSLVGLAAAGPVEKSQSVGTGGVQRACDDLITPDTVGHEEFERLDLATQLRNGEFLRQDSRHYALCCRGRPQAEYEVNYYRLYADLCYLFDRQGGDLVLSYLSRERASQVAETGVAPIPQETEAIPTETAGAESVCLDDETPIIEVGGENPELWGVLDILSSGQCAAEMGSGEFCWDCDAGLDWRPAWPVPVRKADSGMSCIGALAAREINGQASVGPASEQCSLVLGEGRLCWECAKAGAELRLGSPMPGEATAVPAAPADSESLCRAFLTPEKLGRQAFAQYGIDRVLQTGQFQTKLVASDGGQVICFAERRLDGAVVVADELYFRFDVESGSLLMERVHWRRDLPEHLPPLRISQQKAESMVEGTVQRSYLAIISPDHSECGEWFGAGPDPRRVQSTKSTFANPCWLVHSTVEGRLPTPWVTAIDAVTGRVIGRWCPC